MSANGPTPRTNACRFNLIWTGGEYKVSSPNVDTMAVVPALEMESIERELAAVREQRDGLAHQLETELAEALKSAEHAKAYKRTLKEDNANLRRELAEARAELEKSKAGHNACAIVRDQLMRDVDIYKRQRDEARAAFFAAVKGELP